jgi:translation initiation factor IF-3
VLVIDETGRKLGEMLTKDAIENAREKGLDLVEVASNAKPPVCKIMDYGKHQYQKQKRERDAKKKQVSSQVKEIKLRVKTEDHDIQTKLRNMRKFLGQGDKVKLVVIYRGREMAHPELGMVVLKKVIALVEELGTPEYMPKREGRNLVTVIAPLTKSQIASREKALLKKAPAADSEDTAVEKPSEKKEVEGDKGA